MKRQSGFTLIELIIVIVILGILAVTAAPQFFNFGSDARASTVRGMEASVKSASELVYARAAIAGIEGVGESSVSVSGISTGSNDVIQTIYGYPGGSDEGIIAALNANFVEDFSDESDWWFSADGGEVVIYPRGISEDIECNVTYVQAEEGEQPSITVVTTGC